MTMEQTHRKDFWVKCFLEHSARDKQHRPDPNSKDAGYFANVCLEQYDKTFNQTTKD
jgi:hypothetical protein